MSPTNPASSLLGRVVSPFASRSRQSPDSPSAVFVETANESVPAADLETCKRFRETAKALRERSENATERAELTSVLLLISDRLMDLADPVGAGKLSNTSMQPSHGPKPAAPRHYELTKDFCSNWERFGSLLSRERSGLQSVIEALRFRLALQPPIETIRDVLRRSNYESRSRALDSLTMSLEPFLDAAIALCNLSADWCDKMVTLPCPMHPDFCFCERRQVRSELPGEAKRMLKCLHSEIWQSDDADSWKQSVKRAWLAVHPDKNNGVSPLRMEYKHDSNSVDLGDILTVQKMLNASKIEDLLGAMSRLAQADGVLRSVAAVKIAN